MYWFSYDVCGFFPFTCLPENPALIKKIIRKIVRTTLDVSHWKDQILIFIVAWENLRNYGFPLISILFCGFDSVKNNRRDFHLIFTPF